MLVNLTVAAAYFYFNWRYFTLVTAATQRTHMAKLPVVGAFLINYILFFLCSALEFNLIVNWGLFFIFLLVETLLYSRNGVRVPLYLSLTGVLYGLAVNIFCRCTVAIAISQPLASFDNHMGNLKAVPVFFGFLLGGIVFHIMTQPKQKRDLRALIGHPKHLSFQLELMTGMYLYLFLNLLLYQSRENDVLLKLWGIKSAIFAVVGTYLAFRYSMKMCRLTDYREENRAIRRDLAHSEEEGRELRSIACRDTLTGAYSRQYGLELLGQIVQKQERFALAFLDLDDLKGVNDRFDHVGGDRYLVTVTQELVRSCRKDCDVLVRYGGDEFLLIIPDAGADAVEQRIQEVNARLQELVRTGTIPFHMSLSYGVVGSDGRADVEALLTAADEKMYRMKKVGDKH